MDEKLVAIAAIALIAIASIILKLDHEVIYVCITGIAGLAGYSIKKF